MKVAMVGPYPNGPITGGIEAVSAYLTWGLARRRDVELHVVTVTDGPRMSEPNDVHVHAIATAPRWRRASLYWRERRAIASILRKIEPDVVHVQGQNFYAAGALGAKIPSVITLHGMLHKEARIYNQRGGPLAGASKLLRGSFNAYFERQALLHASDLIVISPYVSESIRDMTSARMHRIDNPVADDFFGLGSDEVPGRLFFAGPLEPRKGIHRLVEAVALLQQATPDVHLRIAGNTVDGEYARQLLQDVTDLGISGRVSFLGIISQDDLLDEYRQASLIVMASEEETSPMLLEQAMAAGKAVVAPDVGGIRFVVEQGVTGTLVAPNDEKALADAIGQLLIDDSTRWTMGIEGHKAALARFSIDAVADQTVSTYKAVVMAASQPADTVDVRVEETVGN
jgi:glycosyltransferase involved in cell wall biosynthesis